MKALVMGVCPRCGQAFALEEHELRRPLRLGGTVYLEGRCHWCEVRAIVPADQLFLLEPDHHAETGNS